MLSKYSTRLSYFVPNSVQCYSARTSQGGRADGGLPVSFCGYDYQHDHLNCLHSLDHSDPYIDGLPVCLYVYGLQRRKNLLRRAHFGNEFFGSRY